MFLGAAVVLEIEQVLQPLQSRLDNPGVQIITCRAPCYTVTFNLLCQGFQCEDPSGLAST
jgi:hypothetical protein